MSDLASRLNSGCLCQTLDEEKLRSQLESWALGKETFDEVIIKRPNLFSSTTAFISESHLQKMRTLVTTIEKVIRLPAFQQKALGWAPEIAQVSFGTDGVFMGYDFHMNADGPKLIEINTNAGGALLNVELARAQIRCCSDEWYSKEGPCLDAIDEVFRDMFLAEWRKAGRTAAPKVLAIVDDHPLEQYLYPEFLLFKKLLSSFGLEVLIVDACDLDLENGKLLYQQHTIDLVYNRLTDFYLEEPKHQALREAYLSAAAVVTPNPHHHALFAHKLNLETLTDLEFLKGLGLSPVDVDILFNGIPKTVKVSANNAKALWEERKKYFFKPVAGFGSKATYRGDKITTRVWSEILQSAYVAQEIIHPEERMIMVEGVKSELKMDLRAYAYASEIQLLAARLYSGQTTNFRTKGGGFAPVFVAPT